MDSVAASGRLRAQLSFDSGFPRLDKETERGAFRIIRECLECLHHSPGTVACSIELSHTARTVVVLFRAATAVPICELHSDCAVACQAIAEHARQISAKVSFEREVQALAIRVIIARS